jgi:hypothetical protein
MTRTGSCARHLTARTSEPVRRGIVGPLLAEGVAIAAFPYADHLGSLHVSAMQRRVSRGHERDCLPACLAYSGGGLKGLF